MSRAARSTRGQRAAAQSRSSLGCDLKPGVRPLTPRLDARSFAIDGEPRSRLRGEERMGYRQHQDTLHCARRAALGGALLLGLAAPGAAFAEGEGCTKVTTESLAISGLVIDGSKM